jgi:hypothetical protein
MAKKNLGRLAGLAALAGAAYMGLKGKDKDDAGDQKTSSYTGDTKKVEAGGASLESPEDTIKRSMVKAPGDSKPITEADVVMPEKAAPAAPKKPTPPSASTTAKTDPRINSTRRDLEAGMSRGTRSVPNNNYSNEGRSSAKPPSTMSSSAEGMKNYKPRRAPAAAPFKGGQPGYDEAGNFLGGRRGYDEAGNPMKKGGKVKKMASGGMTVSKRADGIASRGKTKCKMY